MHFGLLLSHLPHVVESRSHYDAMLSLGPAAGGGKFKAVFNALLRRVRAAFA